MEKAGYQRSSSEIESRLNNMRQQYKTVSMEKDAGFQIKWKFYGAMHNIMESEMNIPMDTSEPKK